MDKADIFSLMHHVLSRAKALLQEQGDVPPAAFLATPHRTYVVPACACGGCSSHDGPSEFAQKIRHAAEAVRLEALVTVNEGLMTAPGDDPDKNARECICVEAIGLEGSWRILWGFTRSPDGAAAWDDSPAVPEHTFDSDICAFEDLFRSKRTYQ